MTHDDENVERTTVHEGPGSVRREEVRQTASARSGAGWWIAALVAIVALVALVLVFNDRNRQDELQAAREQGAAQATLDSAATSAQQAAADASRAAQAAMDSTARASQEAAAAAQAAANQTAEATRSAAAQAGDAAEDATATAPAPEQ